jgi:hypothetical protein
MGIVSMSTREARSHVKSAGDVDDPLPGLDEELGLVEDRDHVAPARLRRHLRSTPLIAVVVGVVMLGVAIGLGELFAESPSPSTPATGSTASRGERDAPYERPRGEPGAGDEAAGSPAQATLEVARLGYALDYPSQWQLVDDRDIAGEHPPGAGGDPQVLRISGRNAFSVRTFELARPVTRPDLTDMRAVTDAILSTPGAKLTVLDVRETQVGGLPAVYYLYYFPSGRVQGIHAHYFVFDRARMYSLVFQVVPAARFPAFAAQFDAVVASFRAIS